MDNQLQHPRRQPHQSQQQQSQQQAPYQQPQPQQQNIAGGYLQHQQPPPQKPEKRFPEPSTGSQGYGSQASGSSSHITAPSAVAPRRGGGAGVEASQPQQQKQRQVGHIGSSAGQPVHHPAFHQQQPIYHQYRITPQQQLQLQQQQQQVLNFDPALQDSSLGPAQHQAHAINEPSANAVIGSNSNAEASASSTNNNSAGVKKKRAPPTRWFAADDAAMVRVLLAEKRAGHETEHGFLSSSWERVVEAVQETTLQGQKKDVQPCKDRFKLMIRTLYQPFKELMMHPDFHWSEPEQRFHASAGVWEKQIEVNPFAGRYKSHSFPLFAEFEELVGYRRQAQLGQQLLHIHDPTFSQPHSQTHTHEGSPSIGANDAGQQAGAGGPNAGVFGDHLASLGMDSIEESYMRVNDVASNEDGGSDLLGAALNDVGLGGQKCHGTTADDIVHRQSLAHEVTNAGLSTVSNDNQQQRQQHPPPSNKRAYAAVSTTSLANAAALGVSGIGPPVKRPYFGPSSSTSSIPASHSALPFISAAGVEGSNASHVVASLQQQLATIDPALGTSDSAQALAVIQGQLGELLTLARRGVEIGERVLAALPPQPLAASSLSSPAVSSNADSTAHTAAHTNDEDVLDQRRGSGDAVGVDGSGSPGFDSQQGGPSAPPASASSPPVHESEIEVHSETDVSGINDAIRAENEVALNSQALVFITTTPYLGPSQRAALIERAGWDRDFVGDLVHLLQDHGADDGAGDGDEIRRQLLANALGQTSGGL